MATTAVTPPNANIAFVQPGTANALILTAQAFRFLTNIVNAINGSTSAGISSVVLGNGTTINSGAGSPNGSVAGNLGDVYTNINGGVGATLWIKESGGPATKQGWAAK